METLVTAYTDVPISFSLVDLGLTTVKDVYGVWSPTVGQTSSSVRLHIYVTSHI